jgi:hypothetical protein
MRLGIISTFNLERFSSVVQIWMYLSSPSLSLFQTSSTGSPSFRAAINTNSHDQLSLPNEAPAEVALMAPEIAAKTSLPFPALSWKRAARGTPRVHFISIETEVSLDFSSVEDTGQRFHFILSSH